MTVSVRYSYIVVATLETVSFIVVCTQVDRLASAKDDQVCS